MARKYTQFDHYTLLKRGSRWHFYYYVNGRRVRKSTGKAKRNDAEKFVADFFTAPRSSKRTLAAYIEPFFVWDSCPHVRRLRDEGKSIGQTHVQKCRRWLEMYVFGDPIVTLNIADITRADLLDFRVRLLKSLGDKRNTCNKVMSALKTVFKEAYFRQDILFDPTQGIGSVKEERSESGVFTREEIRRFFPTHGLGPWTDKRDYTCFFLAATTGMRKSEILALMWRDISFEDAVVNIERAWKSDTELGPPKWDKTRSSPLSAAMMDALRDLHESSVRVQTDDLVFCYDDGTRLGTTWWQKRFNAATKRAGIDRLKRNLTPHSLRHTLNTLLRDAGYNPAKIRANLGWSQDRIQEEYTHWGPEHLREQSEFVDALLTTE